MIDYEDQIYQDVVDKLREEYPGIFVGRLPSGHEGNYPRVFFYEATNASAERYLTQEYTETFSDVMYSAEVYSNKQSGSLAETKKIMKTIDEVMRERGFVRILSAPMENLHDATISRRVARWRGTISPDGVVYRR